MASPHESISTFDEYWKDPNKAHDSDMFNLLKPLVNSGNSSAMIRMGRMYRDGRGVEKNIDVAIRWFKNAIDVGDKWGKLNLFDLYWDYEGHKYDSQLFDLLESLVNIGNSSAMIRMGRMYRDGRGVEKNLSKSLSYLLPLLNKKVYSMEFGDMDGFYEFHKTLLLYYNSVSTKKHIAFEKNEKKNYCPNPIIGTFISSLCSEITIDKINHFKNKYLHGDKNLLSIKNCNVDELNFDESGAFSVKCNSAQITGVFVKGQDTKRIYVFLSGKVPKDKNDPDGRIFPAFPRWSYYTQLGTSILSLNDPMTYEGFELGWYWGNKRENYRNYLLDIIHKVTKKYDIDSSDVIFFGSSGGGTVATYLASEFIGSTAVCINPQISIIEKTDDFKKIECLIEKPIWEDDFNRDNYIDAVKKVSNLIYIVNVQSKLDYQCFLNMCDVIGISPKYGLDMNKNIISWIYDAQNTNPHLAFETRSIVFAIDYLCKHKMVTESTRELFFILSELWGEVYFERIKNIVDVD